MRRLALLAMAAAGLFAAGCVSRGRLGDLKDCGRVSVGVGFGLGVDVGLGALSHPSLGFGSATVRIGHESRYMSLLWGDGEGFWPLLPLYYDFLHQFGPVFKPAGATYRRQCISFPLSHSRTQDCWGAWAGVLHEPPRSKFKTATDFEAGATVLAVAGRVGINPLEIVDFVVGFFGFDPARDDPTREEILARMPPEQRAESEAIVALKALSVPGVPQAALAEIKKRAARRYPFDHAQQLEAATKDAKKYRFDHHEAPDIPQDWVEYFRERHRRWLEQWPDMAMDGFLKELDSYRAVRDFPQGSLSDATWQRIRAWVDNVPVESGYERRLWKLQELAAEYQAYEKHLREVSAPADVVASLEAQADAWAGFDKPRDKLKFIRTHAAIHQELWTCLSTGDVPSAVLADIRARALKQHPDNEAYRTSFTFKEVQSWIEYERAERPGIPPGLLAALRRKAERQSPGSYAGRAVSLRNDCAEFRRTGITSLWGETERERLWAEVQRFWIEIGRDLLAAPRPEDMPAALLKRLGARDIRKRVENHCTGILDTGCEIVVIRTPGHPDRYETKIGFPGTEEAGGKYVSF